MKARFTPTAALVGFVFGMFPFTTTTTAQNSSPSSQPAGSSVVQIRQSDQGFELIRNNQPFFICGAGGSLHLESLKAAGGNSIRTWGGDDQTEMLDFCRKLGLAVTTGIWLGQPRQGFRYEDAVAVQRQKENAVAFVHRTKNHAAVLMWGLGNEMEADGNNPLIWQAIDDAAKALKAEDPNHPVMTVIAEIGKDGSKLKQYMKYCPHVDVLGINSYAGLGSLPERIKTASFTRPYVITEYGPAGFWEVATTAWKAPIEPTSTQKAETYRKNYEHTIVGQKGQCLGSYAFYWGQKQEATATWFGMFLNSGERTEAVQTLQALWTGKYPAVRCLRIVKFETSLAQTGMAPSTPGTAEIGVEAADPARLIVRWEVRQESTDRRGGGDLENQPPAVSDCVIEAGGTNLKFRTPPEAGAYRLFVYVYDGKGNAATANSPFLVK